jgi:hypothetical protein
MKILIDNDPLSDELNLPSTFPEFCDQIMGILLTRNRSIPLAVALEATLVSRVADARRLEQECSDMVTQVLLGEPQEIATRWEKICDELKAQIGFLPRLGGLLTETQVNELVDRELKELSRVMQTLHASFNKGDTLEISDSIELRLLPWLRQLRALQEKCLDLVKTLHR